MSGPVFEGLRFQTRLFLIGFVAVLFFPIAGVTAIEFAGPSPGKAFVYQNAHEIIFENNSLRVALSLQPRLLISEITNKLTNTTFSPNKSQLFSYIRRFQRVSRASDLILDRAPRIEDIIASVPGQPLAVATGQQVVLSLRSPTDSTHIEFRIELKDGSNYIRFFAKFTAIPHDLDLERLRMIDLDLPNAKLTGDVDGSPAISDRYNLFVAHEHPLSRCTATHTSIRCELSGRISDLNTHSAVIGVYPPDQLRRAFLFYLERERAHPHRPFLHYNSWYHLNWAGANPIGRPFRKMDQNDALEVVNIFGQKLVRERGLPINAFVFDDGWDDPKTLWGFHDGFPDGFAPVQAAASEYGASLGAWLSPWGGYDPDKRERIHYGRANGFETNKNGLSLAGERYYSCFRNACTRFINTNDFVFFKFDGIGSGNNASGAGSEYAPDVYALLRLLKDLRASKPNLFFNVTVGTWPSPFWLFYADSIWRSGEDISFLGSGSLREQWITYRDSQIYRNIVSRSLFPLSSLMIHGPVVTECGKGETQLAEVGLDLEAFRHELATFFATGTGAQELYISPEAMTDPAWDALAAAGIWAQMNSAILIDSHWIGGAPDRGEVYGTAAWSKERSILLVRNPSDHAQNVILNLDRVLEIPEPAASSFSAHRIEFGTTHNQPAELISNIFVRRLEPFEVALYELLPQ